MTPCSLSISLNATDCHAKLLTFAGSSKYPGQVRDRKETAHKQKWQAEGSHDGGAEEGVWAGWWRCQRTWGQDEESMKSWNRTSVLRLDTTFFQDAAERDAAKEKVEQKMEVTLRHYKNMIWSIIILIFKVRKMKKELKKDLGVDKCKQQWYLRDSLVQLWPVPSDPTWFALTSNLKQYVWIGSGSSLKFKDDSILFKHTALP